MPKKIDGISALAFKALVNGKVQGRHAVGDVPGLYLRIEGNSVAWVLRSKIGKTGRRVEKGLGSYCPQTMTLANAREKARMVRAEIRAGVDPVLKDREQAEAEREAAREAVAKAVTFGDCANIVIATKTKNLTNEKHKAQWRSTLETYCKPLWARPVSAIGKKDIAAVLQPIWHTKAETADRLRGRIEAVMHYAKGMDYREGDNPAEWLGMLEPILGDHSQEAKPQPSLAHRQIGAFMADLRAHNSMSAKALEFLILTATRSNETIEAKWTEIDLEAKLWTIPKARMKAKKEHEIPLSDAAVSLLKSLPRIVGNPYVFPGAKPEKPLSNMAMAQLVRGMNEKAVRYGDWKTGEPIVPHGFRSTFRDWAGDETKHEREVIEHALAHQLKDKAEAAYNRRTALPKRVLLMADWAAYCAKETTNVVAMKAAS